MAGPAQSILLLELLRAKLLQKGKIKMNKALYVHIGCISIKLSPYKLEVTKKVFFLDNVIGPAHFLVTNRLSRVSE